MSGKRITPAIVPSVTIDTFATVEGTMIAGPGEGEGPFQTCGRIKSFSAYRTDTELVFRIEDEFGFCWDNDIYSVWIQNVTWRGVANTCRGAILEVEVALGERDPEAALDELTAGVEGWDEGDDAGDRLESRGWWCIFGCNVALRHLGGRELQQRMATLATSGRAIATLPSASVGSRRIAWL